MRTRWLFVAALAVPLFAWAQSDQEPRVIVVPYPGSSDARPDAGSPAVAEPPPPPPPTNTAPPPPANPPPPASDPNEAPPPPPVSDAPKTIEAQPDPNLLPPPPPPENLQPTEVPTSPPSAMLDGHPREGAFLSGPGSLAFILHHTLLGLTAGVATQLFPRVLHSSSDVRSCNDRIEVSACAQGARLAYLGAGLVGAGVGFASSAVWQFYNWMSERTAYFGIATSIMGGMFGAGLTNLIVNDASATSWGAWAGALAGAWLLAVIGGGDLPMNKGILLVSGGYWALFFTGMIVAIVATTNKNVGDTRPGIDAMLMAPAIGAGAMALALLKFNPSSAQVLRADLFGTAAGLAVLLISGLVLGPNFAHPVPYILSGVAAAGAIATVSLLWAEAAENPSPVDTQSLTPGAAPSQTPAPAPKPKYKGVW